MCTIVLHFGCTFTSSDANLIHLGPSHQSLSIYWKTQEAGAAGGLCSATPLWSPSWSHPVDRLDLPPKFLLRTMHTSRTPTCLAALQQSHESRGIQPAKSQKQQQAQLEQESGGVSVRPDGTVTFAPLAVEPSKRAVGRRAGSCSHLFLG